MFCVHIFSNAISPLTWRSLRMLHTSRTVSSGPWYEGLSECCVCAHFAQCCQFPDVKVPQNIVHAHFAQCWLFSEVKVFQNVVCVHILHSAGSLLVWRSLRMLFMHIVHCMVSLKFVLIPQNDNCTGVSVVSAFLQKIFTFPVHLLEELCHSELYHLVWCTYAMQDCFLCIKCISYMFWNFHGDRTQCSVLGQTAASDEL